MSESTRKPVSLALGAALIGGLGLAAPAFAIDDLAQGYQGSPQETQEAAKTGEGRCGGDADGDHAHDDKAAEGRCGAEADAKKAAEGRCGGHADAAVEAEDAATEGEEKTHAEGKCGEGKCGGAA